MAEPTRVLFLPASGDDVGGGHVLRGLALAAALSERGADCVFAVEAAGARLVERFAGGVTALPRDRSLAQIAEAAGAGVVVIDDYACSAADEGGLARTARLLVVIDDLSDRPHLADLLVDPSFGRVAADYAFLLPTGAKVLAGPAYALLRPPFTQAHPIPIRQQVLRLFLSFGLADPRGITARAAAVLLVALPGVEIEVAVGARASSLPALEAMALADPRLRLHVEADTAALMADCHMAIGAGGSSTWERAVLGLPSVSVIVADNQRALARSLAAAGAQLTLDAADPGFDAALAHVARALAADETLRRGLAKRSRALCDGQGAPRVAEAILRAVSERRGRHPLGRFPEREPG